MYLAWGVVVFALAAWLVHLILRERGASVWIRLGSIALGFFVLLGLWGVLRYLVSVVRWMWH